jgi:hypothetical protein
VQDSRNFILVFGFMLLASWAVAADTPARPTTNPPVITHVLRKQYQVTEKNSSHGTWVTESKYKDVTGRTVSAAKTKGNLTTHTDPSGRIIGYSVAANGKSYFYNAHGRAMKSVTQ